MIFNIKNYYFLIFGFMITIVNSEQVLYSNPHESLINEYTKLANFYGTQIKGFVNKSLGLELVEHDAKIQRKIQDLLSERKINEYVLTSIEWFKNSLQRHDRLEAPVNVTKEMSREVESIHLYRFSHAKFSNFFRRVRPAKKTTLRKNLVKKITFDIYGEPEELRVVLLTVKNAPLIIKTIRKLAKKMGVIVPQNVYLSDSDDNYMINESTLILAKQWLKGFCDDEIESSIAHELAHSQTGTCMDSFDLLQMLMQESQYFKGKQKLGFLVADFILRAIERQADIIAVAVTKNPSAYIRNFQDDKRNLDPEPRSIYTKIPSHPSIQERVGFGWTCLSGQA